MLKITHKNPRDSIIITNKPKPKHLPKPAKNTNANIKNLRRKSINTKTKIYKSIYTTIITVIYL
jgi:hypothetical protein